MKTVKQKLEAQVKRIEDTFPQLITNQMYLGTKDHPDLKLWNETSWLVGSWTLSKWRNLKYILKVWNSLDLSKPNAVVLEIDHSFKKKWLLSFSKTFKRRTKMGGSIMNKHLRKELKKLTFNWGMYNQKDPLKDKAGLIKALDLVHKADRAIKLDILKQQYYYNNVNTNKGGK
jgi:hypothetical protein